MNINSNDQSYKLLYDSNNAISDNSSSIYSTKLNQTVLTQLMKPNSKSTIEFLTEDQIIIRCNEKEYMFTLSTSELFECCSIIDKNIVFANNIIGKLKLQTKEHSFQTMQTRNSNLNNNSSKQITHKNDNSINPINQEISIIHVNQLKQQNIIIEQQNNNIIKKRKLINTINNNENEIIQPIKTMKTNHNTQIKTGLDWLVISDISSEITGNNIILFLNNISYKTIYCLMKTNNVNNNEIIYDIYIEFMNNIALEIAMLRNNEEIIINSNNNSNNKTILSINFEYVTNINAAIAKTFGIKVYNNNISMNSLIKTYFNTIIPLKYIYFNNNIFQTQFSINILNYLHPNFINIYFDNNSMKNILNEIRNSLKNNILNINEKLNQIINNNTLLQLFDNNSSFLASNLCFYSDLCYNLVNINNKTQMISKNLIELQKLLYERMLNQIMPDFSINDYITEKILRLMKFYELLMILIELFNNE